MAAVGGFLLAVYLIIESGAAQVAHAMLVIGWWLVPISFFHLLPMLFSALSWRELIPAPSRPDAFTSLWIRWIRESINSLLPVAGIGGDVASIRLARLQGVSATDAATSMVVDTTLGAATQLVFALSGVGLLLMLSTERSALIVAGTVLIATALLCVGTAAFVLFQHRGLFAGIAKIVRRLLPEEWRLGFAAGASAVDDAVVQAYRRRRVIFRASLLRLIGWTAGAGEVWLVLQALGHPIGILEAFVLESLGAGVRAAAFMIPGALGALEASLILFGALFSLPADTALAISLSKRVRELAWGVPGLLVWHWIEGHYFLRRASGAGEEATADSGTASGSSSAGESTTGGNPTASRSSLRRI